MNLDSVENRIQTFVQLVREGVHHFMPETNWWLLYHNQYSLDNMADSVTLVQQLGMEDSHFEKLSSRWRSKIGVYHLEKIEKLMTNIHKKDFYHNW